MNTKKIASLGVLACLAAFSSAQQISVTINDAPVDFPEAQPQFIHGRVLVPMRGVFEQMGANVRWNQANQSIRAEKDGRVIRLKIGSRDASVDGRTVHLDVPAMIVEGSTLVPIRFLSESLGAQVGWNESSQLVSIMTSGSGRYSDQERNNNNNNNNRDRQDRQDRQQGDSQQDGLLPAGTIIPVVLNQALVPNRLRSGTRFSATVDVPDTRYGGIPRGTLILGRVVSANMHRDDDFGTFELVFDKLQLPNGRTIQLGGSPIELDSRYGRKDDRGIWRSTMDLDRTWQPNMRLQRGTQIGVRLNHAITIRLR